MPWIKKNLALVLGGLVGLVLLGGSAFFLFAQSAREESVNAALEEKRTEWNRLNELNPYPEEKNIKAVRDEAARVDKLTAALRESIKPPAVPPITDTFSLKLLIETTISELNKEAEEAGVNLPDRYAFTFQKLREMPQFESNGIPKLAEQVSEITTLCRVLFNAKIHSLDQLRRSPVLRDEGGGSDYLTKKPVTNNLVIRAPYDLSFRSFSSELASVLSGLAALEEVVVIKTINIEPTTLPQSFGSPQNRLMPIQPTMTTPGVMPGAPGSGMDPALRARYGLGPASRAESEGGGMAGGGGGLDPRYGVGPGGSSGASMRSRYGGVGGPAMAPPPSLSAPMMQGIPAPAAPSGPSVVLDEKPLRVILQLDFIKPKPEPAPGARRAPRPPVAEEASGEVNAEAPAEAEEPASE